MDQTIPTYLKFEIPFTTVLKDVRIYQVKIYENPDYLTYSYYFRYNSLLKLNQEAKKESKLYPPAVYPIKLRCPCCCGRRKINRSKEFIEFFSNFAIRMNGTILSGIDVDIISNITIFLKVFGLQPSLTDENIDKFSENLDVKLENPFIFEENKENEETKEFEESKENPEEINEEFYSKADEIREIQSIETIKQTKKIFSLNINGKDYKFYRKKYLGGGSYGQVYLYSLEKNLDENFLFAVKFINFMKKENETERRFKMNSILSESKLFNGLKHENVVKGYFYFKINIEEIWYFCNFMEYCNGENLEEYLKKRKAKGEFLQEEEIFDIFLQILKGMHYIYSYFQAKGNNELLMHRDLRPDNIFFHYIDKDHRIVKIGDFGLAKKYLKSSKLIKGSHEPNRDYRSPQTAIGKNFENCDIWSLGVILYNMCFYKFPWEHQPSSYMTYVVQEGLLKKNELSFEDLGRTISEDLKNLLKQMIVFDNQKRINWVDLFENNLFKRELQKDLQKYKEKLTEKKAQTAPVGLKPIKKNSENQQKISLFHEKPTDQKFVLRLQKLLQKNNQNLLENIMETKSNLTNNLNDTINLVSFDQDRILERELENMKFLKVMKSKVLFLKFLDSKIKKDFTHFGIKIENDKIMMIRFYIQKLKIAIILKSLDEVIKENDDFRQEFMALLSKSMDKFIKLQDEFYKKATAYETKFLGKEIEIDYILRIINPHIYDWDEFFNEFATILKPIINSFQNFIKENILEQNEDYKLLSKEKKENYRKIIMIYKNLCILINLNKIFSERNNEKVCSVEKFKKNDLIDYPIIIKKLF